MVSLDSLGSERYYVLLRGQGGKVVLSLARRFPQIGLADDVVAVEDGARAVPGDLHRYSLRDSGAHHIADGGAAQVVEQLAFELRVAHRYPPDTKVITLTAVANGGIWTEDEVVGLNYWHRQPKQVEDIPLDQGDHVALRLRSVDVLHSFAIPLLHLGPVDVPAGHTVELEFTADRAGVLTFLCWQVCSPDHPKLRGRFVVKGSNEEETW